MPCGTLSAHRWHRRNGQPPCQLCKEAFNEDQRARRVQYALKPPDSSAPAQLVELNARLAIEPEEWLPLASCFLRGTALWYPEDDDPGTEGRAICAECPVRGRCLEDALRVAPIDDFGIRGGLDEDERQPLRKLWSVSQPCAYCGESLGEGASDHRRKYCGRRPCTLARNAERQRAKGRGA
jgi:hypothetical protein